MTSEPTIFTRIINREVPAEIAFENDRIIVIHDIKKDAKVHLLGITKVPYLNIHDLLNQGEGGKDLLWELFTVLAHCAEEFGVDKTGYRLTTNNGLDAHQLVPHFHVHLLGGELLHVTDPQ